MSVSGPQNLPRSQQAIALLWPSFIVAVVASGLFFSAFNPRDLFPYNLDLQGSPLAAYSVGFLLFWALGILSSYGTLYFMQTNRRGRSQDSATREGGVD